MCVNNILVARCQLYCLVFYLGGLDHLSGFKLYITKDEKGIQELITEPPSEFASIYTFLFSPFRKITDIMIRRPQADDAIIVLCEVQVYAGKIH